MRALGSASMLLLVAACASAPTPQDTVREYAKAVRNGDAARVYDLSDQQYQRMYGPADVKRALAATDRSQAAAQLEAQRSHTATALVVLDDGTRVRLVMEDRGWRIASGGIEPASVDEPVEALATFLRAALTGRLAVVRGLMPPEFYDRYLADETLAAHLMKQRSRLREAQEGISGLKADAAVIDGDRASIAYGDGKSAQLVRVDGQWRVLDVE